MTARDTPPEGSGGEPDPLQRARAAGNETAIVELLLEWAENQPLFEAALPALEARLWEARERARRVVLSDRAEVLHRVRGAEALLARGAARGALELAEEARRECRTRDLPGLEDRAAMVAARALVRLGRQGEAIRRFYEVVARETSAEAEEPIAAGLAFLAVGEAHLFEGRYDGAVRPLERALGLLPGHPCADRYRYDALLGLAMLDHRAGALEQALLRVEAALRLAVRHDSPAEQMDAHLLRAVLLRVVGQPAAAAEALRAALRISADLPAPALPRSFPLERLRNLAGCEDVATAIDAATMLAHGCGAVGDLMGYVQLVALVAALLDLDGRTHEAASLLSEVGSGLARGGQRDAAALVQRHRDAYG